MSDRAKTLTRLKAKLIDAIEDALEDPRIGNGSVGCVSSDMAEWMADAAVRVWDQCGRHEEWIKRET